MRQSSGNRPFDAVFLSGTEEHTGLFLKFFLGKLTFQYGILRFIVDKPEAAMEALKGAGCACVVSPVICLKLVDEPGELSRVMGVLAKCGINVVYSYSMISTYIVLSTSEPERAQALLADEPVELISQEDIARIVAERAAKEA